MRRRSPLLLRLRGVFVLLALLSQVGFGNAQSLRCDMHGLGAMESTHATASTQAAPTAMMQHAAAHHGGSDASHHGCHCTCVGDCSAAVALPTTPSASMLRIALVVPKARLAVDTTAARPSRPEPDRLLPFANGPPATALL